MKNPWNSIKLEDYENHMSYGSVKQLQLLNELMYDQLYHYDASSVMILGIAGGNGLNHIRKGKFDVVYGVDINPSYLEECKKRYQDLGDTLKTIETDLTADAIELPHADLLIANLLVEYVGYQKFQDAIQRINPRYITCIIQINTEDGFVSASPYVHVFEPVGKVHHQMSEYGMTKAMLEIGYKLILTEETELPYGKKLERLDYIHS